MGKINKGRERGGGREREREGGRERGRERRRGGERDREKFRLKLKQINGPTNRSTSGHNDHVNTTIMAMTVHA